MEQIVIKKLAVVLCGVCLSSSVMAKTQAEFQQYLTNLKQEAIAKGYDTQLIEQAFASAAYKEKVISADKNQPEVKETLETYLPKRVPQWKIDRARKLYKENQDILEKVAKDFGVQARFIVAIWGLESNFGAIQGGHNCLLYTSPSPRD